MKRILITLSFSTIVIILLTVYFFQFNNSVAKGNSMNLDDIMIKVDTYKLKGDEHYIDFRALKASPEYEQLPNEGTSLIFKNKNENASTLKEYVVNDDKISSVKITDSSSGVYSISYRLNNQTRSVSFTGKNEEQFVMQLYQNGKPESVYIKDSSNPTGTIYNWNENGELVESFDLSSKPGYFTIKGRTE